MLERMPPDWEPLLRDAGRHQGLEPRAAAEFAQQGILSFDDIVVALVDRRVPGTAVDNDLSIVCPLTGLGPKTQAAMLRVLRANYLLASTTGFSIGATSDDELHLIHTTRAGEVGAERLAALIGKCASLAGALQREFANALPEGAGLSWPEAVAPVAALVGGVWS